MRLLMIKLLLLAKDLIAFLPRKVVVVVKPALVLNCIGLGIFGLLSRRDLLEMRKRV